MQENQLITFRMSGAGACIKQLVAQGLRYDPLPESEESLTLMAEASLHEALVFNQLKTLGWGVSDRQLEVKYEGLGYTLIGHIDGLAFNDKDVFLLEIKALGHSTFPKFKKEGLFAFSDYVAQVSAYQNCLPLPVLMAVKSRDTGELCLKTYDETIPEFEAIDKKLEEAAKWIKDGLLPEGSCDWIHKNRCRFSYLCKEKKVESSSLLPEPVTEELVNAAELWKEGDAEKEIAEGKIEKAKQVFLAHFKGTPGKVSVNGLSATYSGYKSRKYLDEKTVRSVVPEEMLKTAERETKPYDDIRFYKAK